MGGTPSSDPIAFSSFSGMLLIFNQQIHLSILAHLVRRSAIAGFAGRPPYPRPIMMSSMTGHI
eukprot:5261244-Pyramimonas_sp.AAC.1